MVSVARWQVPGSLAPVRPQAAVGFTVKSGWASVVLLDGPESEPAVRRSQRLELCDPSVPEARQPYHAGFGKARTEDETLHRLVAEVERFGTRAVAELLTEYRSDKERRIVGAGLVVGSLIDPDTIANPHIRIHALEGRLFRQCVEAGARECQMAMRTWRERSLYADAAGMRHRAKRGVADTRHRRQEDPISQSNMSDGYAHKLGTTGCWPIFNQSNGMLHCVKWGFLVSMKTHC